MNPFPSDLPHLAPTTLATLQTVFANLSEALAFDVDLRDVTPDKDGLHLNLCSTDHCGDTNCDTIYYRWEELIEGFVWLEGCPEERYPIRGSAETKWKVACRETEAEQKRQEQAARERLENERRAAEEATKALKAKRASDLATFRASFPEAAAYLDAHGVSPITVSAALRGEGK